MDHLHLSNKDYICCLRDGTTFDVRGGTDDRHAIFEVFAQRIYPVSVSAGDTVVDIGAQIGCFTVWAARQGARVFSFEPFPLNFLALQGNVARNRLTEVVLVPQAISGKRERRKIFLPDDRSHTGRYSLHGGRGTQTIEVPCVPLDDVVHEHQLTRVDVLKIDCQGSEYEILYEAAPQTLVVIQTVIVECETFSAPPEWSPAGLKAYMERQGFLVETDGKLLLARRPESR
jgi:FkbM family methyltransferase